MEKPSELAIIFPQTIDAAFAAARADEHQLPNLLQLCRPLLTLMAHQSLGPQFRRREGDSEVVQGTVVEAIRDFSVFQGRTLAEFLSWLKRLHANNIQNIVRYHRAGKRDLRREVQLTNPQDPDLSLSWYVTAKATQPDVEIINAEKAVELAAAIDRLPEAQKTAVTMRHIQGASLAAICEAMDKTPAAVAGLLRRGLQALREQLGKESNWL